MRISSHKLLDITEVTTATSTSDPYQIEHLIGFSISVVYTPGTNFTGTIIVQASNDETNWSNVSCVSVNGTNTNQMINVKDAFYKTIRVSVEITTGSITALTADIYTKGW
jgi:hypothetical protein